MKKPTLKETQEWMNWIITDARGVKGALEDTENEMVEDFPPISASERLDIYAEAYFARIYEALSIDFSITKLLLTEESFAKIVAEYLKAYPSREFNLNNISENFVRFIKSYTDNSCFQDLAHLERLAVESFYSDSSGHLDLQALSKLTNEQQKLKFKINPSVYIIESRWPLDELWKTREVEKELVLSETPDLRAFLLFRQHHEIQLIKLSNDQWKLFLLLKEEKSLEEIYETLSIDDHQTIGTYFTEWANLNLFSSFYL